MQAKNCNYHAVAYDLPTYTSMQRKDITITQKNMRRKYYFNYSQYLHNTRNAYYGFFQQFYYLILINFNPSEAITPKAHIENLVLATFECYKTRT